MKKRILAGILVLVLAFGMAGCGNSQEKSGSENSESKTQKEEAEVKEEPSKESSELNEYGLTAAQQEALLEAVKESVTEGYLKKHNISASEFKVLPYDVNEWKNYTGEDWKYTGQDPYEWTQIWNCINTQILNSALGDRLSVFSEQGFEKEMLVEALVGVEFGDSSVTYKLEPSMQDLLDAVYAGIVKFVNGLEEEERAEVLVNIYLVWNENNEATMIERPGDGANEYPSVTMFDKVISENIQL